MSRLQCRGSIILVALMAALFSSRSADAQVYGNQGPPREPGGLLNNLVTGVQYDIVNQKHAERRIEKLQSKIRRESGRCDSAAVDRDVRRIDDLRYRIVVDEWLIRKNLLLDPGCYPYSNRPDPVSRAAMAQASHPVPSAYTQRFIPNP